MNWPGFCFFDVTSIQVPSVQSSSYQGYTVRITPFVLIIFFKKDAFALQSLITAMKELYLSNNFSFIQDSALFLRAKIIQNFIRKELKSRFVANTEWPPSSPNCNLLDYYFWNEVKGNVCSGQDAKHFESEKELKGRMFSVYD